MLKHLKSLFFTISLNTSVVFFSIYSILGKDYTSLSEDSSFLIFIILSTIISFTYVILDFIRNGSKTRQIHLFFYLLPIIILFIYLLESPVTDIGKRGLTLYLPFSVPFIYLGVNVALNQLLKSMIRWFDLIWIITTLGIFFSLGKVLNLEGSSIGGASYQSLSYMAAYAFSLNLFFLFFGNRFNRFKFTRNKLFRIFSYFALFIQISGVFFSGGRGGSILLLISIIVLSYIRLKNGVSFAKFSFLTLIFSALFFFIPRFMPSDIQFFISRGGSRIFKYFTSSGINMSETGRNLIFLESEKLINSKPIFGHGLFKYIDISGAHPHNIFLEFLLQGGILYLIFWIIVLILFLIKFYNSLKIDIHNLFIIPIAIYPFTMLMFSGTYLHTGLFWFTITYVFSYKKSFNNNKVS
tara:strand:- start:9440 stop:10669 length:1230 start_codon:yes stop_codon:yes gene_type:complete